MACQYFYTPNILYKRCSTLLHWGVWHILAMIQCSMGIYTFKSGLRGYVYYALKNKNAYNNQFW